MPTTRVTNALAFLLYRHLRPFRSAVGLLVALQLLQTAALLYLPTLSADVIDNGALAGDLPYIVQHGAVMVAVVIGQVICQVGAFRTATRLAMSVGRELREAVFSQILTMSGSEVQRLGTSSLSTRAVNDVQYVQTFALTGLSTFVAIPIMGTGGVALAFTQDVASAVLVLVMVSLISTLVLAIIRRQRPLLRSAQCAVDGMSRILREQIAGVRVVRAFDRDEFEQRRFARTNHVSTELGVRAGRLTTAMLPLAVTVTNLFGVLLVWLGVYRVYGGHVQVGAITAFLGYLALILVAITTGMGALMALPRALACAERITEVLNTPTSVTSQSSMAAYLPVPGHVDLQDVHVRQVGAESDTLRGINLIARPGQVTALTGSTGAGKTTLVNLIVRLADATAGHVIVGGVDVRDIDRAVLSRAVGLVPQRPFLSAGTVGTNVRWGRPDATDGDLWRALEIAQARDFVERMPGRLEAKIVSRGANLSRGQQQRLAIARALVARPPIFLLDDPFSSLDEKTAASVRGGFLRAAADATIVLVSQQVSAIRDADRIVVLDAGEVAGTGTHDSLLATNTVYRELVLSQADEGHT